MSIIIKKYINKEQNIITNYGILASISWNSLKWSGPPTQEDLTNSKYEWVRENKFMHESLNFGHEIYPAEEDGYYLGYTAMLRKQN